MSYIRLFKQFKIIALLICLICSSQLAEAAGFQLNEVSPMLQGDATAGSAAAVNDVSASLINPATLATLLHNQAYLGASAIFPNIQMNGATAIHTVNIPGSPPDAITAPVIGVNREGNIGSLAFVPDAYLGWRINESLVAGIAITSPFGLVTTYSNDSVLRFVAQKSSLLTININPALALQLNPEWAVGLGLQFQYARAILSSFDGTYTGIPALDAFLAANYPTKLKANGWGYGANFGFIYTPCRTTRFGVGYRSKIVQDLSGHGQQYTVPGPTVPAPSQDFPFNAETSVDGTINIPAVLTLSAQQDIANWTFKASAQLNFWSSFKHLSINTPDAFAINTTIDAHWDNVWLLALGADYCFSRAWTFRGGIAYDESPTNTQFREPRIPDTDRYWLTGGFTYRMNNNLSIDGAYEHIFARNQVVNTTVSYGSSPTSTVLLESNQVHAHYQSSIDIVALAIRYSFC